MIGNAISIAAIHATVFSIIFGFVVAYIFYMRNLVANLEQAVLSEAVEINSVRFSFSNCWPEENEMRDFDPENERNRTEKINDILYQVDGVRGFDQFDQPQEPGELVKKCVKLLSQIDLVIHSYPFPGFYTSAQQFPELFH